MCASRYLGFEMHDVHVLCQSSSVGQECICSVFCLLVFRIVQHVLDRALGCCTTHGPLVQKVAVLSLLPLPEVQIIWQLSMSRMGRLQHMTVHRCRRSVSTSVLHPPPPPLLHHPPQLHLPRSHHLHPQKHPLHRNPYLLESGCHLPPTNECFVAYVKPLLVYHHLRFKPPEDGLHVYHATLAQATLGFGSVIFSSFTVAWTRGGLTSTNTPAHPTQQIYRPLHPHTLHISRVCVTPNCSPPDHTSQFQSTTLVKYPPPPCACTALSKHEVGVAPPFWPDFWDRGRACARGGGGTISWPKPSCGTNVGIWP